MKKLPNYITYLRMVLIIIIIVLNVFPFVNYNISFSSILGLEAIRFWTLVLFTVASATDFLDGYLARKLNAVSTIGKLLDPIADKMLINTTAIIFTITGDIPLVATLLFILRDLLVDGLRLLLAEKGVVLSASVFGKAKTVAQIIALILVIANFMPGEFPLPLVMLWIAVGLSLLSGGEYFIRNYGGLNERKSD